jgi:hypothetical protein
MHMASLITYAIQQVWKKCYAGWSQERLNLVLLLKMLLVQIHL